MTVNRLWHAVIAVLVAFALISTFVLVLKNDRSVTNLFSYFTVESNILVMVTAALVAVRPDRGGTIFGIVRLGALVGITITGLVFSTILAGSVPLDGLDWVNDKIFHYVVPAMSVIGYVVFSPRTRFSRTALWFLAWALAWLVYTLIRAEVSEPRYPGGKDGAIIPVPYGFLDADEHGWTSVTIASVLVLVLGLALSAFYLWWGNRDREVTRSAR